MTNFYTADILAQHKLNLAGRLQVGRFTYGHPVIFEWDEGARLVLGSFCSIAEGVTMCLGGEHRTDWVTTYPFSAIHSDFPEAASIVGHPKTKGDVRIGNDVWIGYGATIMSGVKIGDGAVIGARSVVSRDVEPYAIVAGNPAQFVKKRFRDDEIATLLELRWWDWPIEMIKKNVDKLCCGDVRSLVKCGQPGLLEKFKSFLRTEP